MGFWDFIKSTASKIGSTVKALPGRVIDTARNIAGKISQGFDKVRGIANTATNLPVVGELIKQLPSMSPHIGKAVELFNKGDAITKGIANELDTNPVITDMRMRSMPSVSSMME
jgi:hypothetical protein